MSARRLLAPLAATVVFLGALGGGVVLAGPAAAGGHGVGRRVAARHVRACHRRHRRCHRQASLRRGAAGGPAPATGSGGASAPVTGSTARPGSVGGSAESAPVAAGQAGGSGAAPAEEAPAGGPAPARVQVVAKEYSLTLSRAEVPAGEVIVEFVNGGEDPHNLHVEEPAAGAEAGAFPTSSPKTHTDLRVELRPGSYTLFCSLQGHEAKGMKATLLAR